MGTFSFALLSVNRLVYKANVVRILCFALITFHAGEIAAQGRMQYENRNQVDYGPLVVRKVMGVVLDAHGVPIPTTNIGIFTESAHQLIFQTTSNSGGYFSLGNLPKGEYRLVAQYDHFCSANARIVIATWPRGGWIRTRKFYIRMIPAGLDTCSTVFTYQPMPSS
jgi:Carboxypeptidase regulatory-like domain